MVMFITSLTHQLHSVRRKLKRKWQQSKISSNRVIFIHWKNASIMLRPTEVQSLIQDLVYARKPIARTLELRIIDEMNCDAENIYLKALIGIVVKLMCKGMYAEVYKR